MSGQQPRIPAGFRAPLSWMVIAVVLFAITQLAPVTNAVTASDSYTGLHLVMEMGAIAISLMVFALAWNLRKSPVNNYIIVLGLTSFAGLALDIPHALSYAGMPTFFGSSGYRKIDLLLAAGQNVHRYRSVDCRHHETGTLVG